MRCGLKADDCLRLSCTASWGKVLPKEKLQLHKIPPFPLSSFPPLLALEVGPPLRFPTVLPPSFPLEVSPLNPARESGGAL